MHNNRKIYLAALILLLHFIVMPSMATSKVMHGVSVGSNRDYPGSDYAQFTVYELERCVISCANDPFCKAFSYDRNTYSCRLKDTVPQPVRLRGMLSGRKIVADGPPPPTLSSSNSDNDIQPPNSPDAEITMEIIHNTYFYGGDYRKITTKNHKKCAKKCKKDESCRVFSFDQRTKECWLKTHRRSTIPKSATISGIKRYTN